MKSSVFIIFILMGIIEAQLISRGTTTVTSVTTDPGSTVMFMTKTVSRNHYCAVFFPPPNPTTACPDDGRRKKRYFRRPDGGFHYDQHLPYFFDEGPLIPYYHHLVPSPVLK